MSSSRLGILVGMQWEANLAHSLNPIAIEASGATCAGAQAALDRLQKEKVDSIISFGFAAGLDPVMKAGTIVIPHSVSMSDQEYKADPILRLRLGAEKSKVKVGALLHSNHIMTSVQEKEAYFKKTGCVAADMESGLVAEFCQQHRLSFAVLRVICDPATRNLPPLACMALAEDGSLNFSKIIGNLFSRPSQINSLIGVGIDMMYAYWCLNSFVSVCF